MPYEVISIEPVAPDPTSVSISSEVAERIAADAKAAEKQWADWQHAIEYIVKTEPDKPRHPPLLSQLPTVRKGI